jgi:Zn-dependent protease
LAASVVIHELGHTLVSQALGLPVSRIVVFLLGGVSEIEGEAQRPRDEFLIAAAGPAASLLLGAGLWAAQVPMASGSTAEVLVMLLAWSNLVIALFNVLPGLPLDGGRLVQATVWSVSKSRLTGVRIAAHTGRVLAVLLAVAVFAANVELSRRHDGALSFSDLGAVAMGIGLAAFLWMGATQTLRLARLNDRATVVQVSQLVRPTVYLTADTPVSEAVRQVSAAHASAIVVIDAQGRTRGIVRESDIAGLALQQRPWTGIGEFARPLEPGLILTDDLRGPDLIQRVQTTPASEYLVLGADGVARGVLATADLVAALGLTPTAARLPAGPPVAS